MRGCVGIYGYLGLSKVRIYALGFQGIMENFVEQTS